MGNCLREFKCCETYDRDTSIPILILGLKNSGKTDIAFRLINKKRDDFHTTNGCRIFSTKINKRLIKFTELGGEEFYDIWKYYFLDVFGVIYVIDSSDHSQLKRSKEIFGSIMSNDLLMGKPMLILSNKQDKPGSLDSLDICDYFEIEYLANLFRTPCYVEGVGQYDRSFDTKIAMNACSWLVDTICKNYKSIQNKIRFLRVVTQNESLSSNEEIPRNNKRPVTGKRKKKLRFSQNRPKTAPNTKASTTINTRSFLTSSNLPSTLRSKKSNQVSPMYDNFSLRFNYDVACERHIREGLKAGLINGIITVSEMTEKSSNLESSMIVEDLSLPPSLQQEMRS